VRNDGSDHLCETDRFGSLLGTVMNRQQDAQPGVPVLTDALTELANLLVATPGMDRFLTDLARVAGAVITPPAACGITLAEDHRPLTVASSDPLAAHVDEVQYGQDQGPCLQAMRTGEIVLAADMSTEQRWGAYPAHALSYGVRSSLSLPLTINGYTRGALNLYAGTVHAFGPSQQRHAKLFAGPASAALTVITRQVHQVQLTEQLHDALATRAVIDQALGILMGHNRCDFDTAFAILRTSSQHQNRKLRDVATDIVKAVSGVDPQPPPFNDPE
jgi:GAF domain-containing protein